MPSLNDVQAIHPLKMLCVGNSGTGKTGALASLAAAGFNIRILDFDNGIGTLAAILKEQIAAGKVKPDVLSRVVYEPCQDTLRNSGGKIMPIGMPTAFTKALNLMTSWKPKDGADLGAVSSWGTDDILVIDSLSHLSNAALRYVLAMNNRSGDHPYQSDWGEAMSLIENVLALLYSSSIKCHVIINAHITRIGSTVTKTDKNGNPIQAEILSEDDELFPNTLGKKLPPKVASYFNTMLKFDTAGYGATTKRIIRTIPNDNLAVKSEIRGLPKELPIESGLADIFKAAGFVPSTK